MHTYNTIKMLKKFFAGITLLATLASATAFAQQIGPDEPYTGETSPSDLIQNLQSDPGIFNPSLAETQTISFDLAEGGQVHAFVDVNPKVFLASYEDTAAGSVAYTWDGKDASGNLLADGDYEIKINLYQGTVLADVGFVQTTIDSTTGGPQNPGAPEISDFDIDPATFNPDAGETTDIEFTTDKNGYVSVIIKDSDTSNANDVRLFSSFDGDFKSAGDYVIEWDGRNANGNIVSDGTYYVFVTASSDTESNTVDSSVVVDTTGSNPGNSDLVKDLELDPSDEWDPTDEDLEIDFDLTDDVDVLVIEAKNLATGEVEEIIDEDNVDEGDQEFSWDGTENGGDYIEEGTWQIIIHADNDKVTETIKVDYDDPEIDDAFVTKDQFDNEQDEFTYLVFKSTEDAIATVEVFDGSKKKETLMDEEDIDGGDWIVVKFDGTDDDGDELKEGGYDFKITLEGEGEGTDDVEKVDFDIKEDDVSSDKVNATNDYTDPVVFDEKKDSTMEIHFCIDEEADVDLNIYDGKSASGKVEAELLDDVTFARGCHTINWNLEDEDGKMLKEDIYSWKLVAKDGSKKDTETGRFVVGEETDDSKKKKDPKPPVGSGDCGGYWDTQNVGYELCEALDWLKAEGIMTGNPDGSFRPYDAINRAEVLRVTLEAFEGEATILPANGSNFGFWDVSPFAWYAQYVRTAKFYGMLHGYLNSTEARLSQTINRVELLKFVLEATDAFTDWEKPGFESAYYLDVDAKNPLHDWFFDYAGVSHQYGLFDGSYYLSPGSLVNRGEAALVLYRLHKSGLID